MDLVADGPASSKAVASTKQNSEHTNGSAAIATEVTSFDDVQEVKHELKVSIEMEAAAKTKSPEDLTKTTNIIHVNGQNTNGEMKPTVSSNKENISDKVKGKRVHTDDDSVNKSSGPTVDGANETKAIKGSDVTNGHADIGKDSGEKVEAKSCIDEQLKTPETVELVQIKNTISEDEKLLPNVKEDVKGPSPPCTLESLNKIEPCGESTPSPVQLMESMDKIQPSSDSNTFSVKTPEFLGTIEPCRDSTRSPVKTPESLDKIEPIRELTPSPVQAAKTLDKIEPYRDSSTSPVKTPEFMEKIEPCLFSAPSPVRENLIDNVQLKEQETAILKSAELAVSPKEKGDNSISENVIEYCDSKDVIGNLSPKIETEAPSLSSKINEVTVISKEERPQEEHPQNESLIKEIQRHSSPISSPVAEIEDSEDREEPKTSPKAPDKIVEIAEKREDAKSESHVEAPIATKLDDHVDTKLETVLDIKLETVVDTKLEKDFEISSGLSAKHDEKSPETSSEPSTDEKPLSDATINQPAHPQLTENVLNLEIGQHDDTETKDKTPESAGKKSIEIDRSKTPDDKSPVAELTVHKQELLKTSICVTAAETTSEENELFNEMSNLSYVPQSVSQTTPVSEESQAEALPDILKSSVLDGIEITETASHDAEPIDREEHDDKIILEEKSIASETEIKAEPAIAKRADDDVLIDDPNAIEIETKGENGNISVEFEMSSNKGVELKSEITPCLSPKEQSSSIDSSVVMTTDSGAMNIEMVPANDGEKTADFDESIVVEVREEIKNEDKNETKDDEGQMEVKNVNVDNEMKSEEKIVFNTEFHTSLPFSHEIEKASVKMLPEPVESTPLQLVQQDLREDEKKRESEIKCSWDDIHMKDDEIEVMASVETEVEVPNEHVELAKEVTEPSPLAQIEETPEASHVENKDGDHDSGVDESTQRKDGVEESPTKKPTTLNETPSSAKAPPKTSATPKKSPSVAVAASPAKVPKPPSSTSSQGSVTQEKKLPMNKIVVGTTPSPNLKVVKSKIGSLENAHHKAGGGNVKLETKKINITGVKSKIGSTDNIQHKPLGGDKKILSRKLEWKGQSKVGSLDNTTHKPGGGAKKIESVKLNFKETAKPKVGSRDNVQHKAGGGQSQIEEHKLNFKDSAKSKVGSMDNVTHKAGGGNVQIFDEKLYYTQTLDEKEEAASPTPLKTENGLTEGENAPVVTESAQK